MGLVWLVLLLLVGVLGAGAYQGWRWFQQHDFSVLQSVGEGQQVQQNTLSELKSAIQSESQARSQLQNELMRANGELQVEVERQGERMEAMAAISTDDWRLAEAEYLLRLAGQRLAMAQSGGVLPLLIRADTILRDLDDSQLTPVRRALAADITALKMAGSVDREGIYLRLSALKSIIARLNIVPDPELTLDLESDTAAATVADQVVSEGGLESNGNGLNDDASALMLAWGRFTDHAGSAFERFRREHFQVRTLDAPLQPLMNPNQEIYLRQNLQLMLSQAQSALLERESAIYQDSLRSAAQWLKTFFQLEEQANFVVAELAILEQQQISTRLPDISASIDSLKAYIERRASRYVPESEGTAQ